ncbi:MAG: hypothetical protein ACLPHI_05020 [Terriglobales bacterium]
MCPRPLLSILLTLIILAAVLVTIAPAQVPAPPSTAPGTAVKPPRQEPCWQVAGISKAAMQQRRAITQQAHQEVEGVCANSSLTIEQQREQIHQIHQRERQQIEAIITPAQQETLRSCQEARGTAHGGGVHAARGGPCGEMPAGNKANPQHEEDDAPPDQNQKPN